MRRKQIGDHCWEIKSERRANCSVKRVVFAGSDRSEPIILASIFAYQKPIEQSRGTSILHDPRQVLAAHLVNVINPDIGWDHVVSRRTMRTLPLDKLGRTTSESVFRLEQRGTIRECRIEGGDV